MPIPKVQPAPRTPTDYGDLQALLGMQSQQPALQLAALRGKRQDELTDRTINDPNDQRAKALLADVTNEIDSDPDTGTDARQSFQDVTDEQHKSDLYNLPGERQKRGDAQTAALEKLLNPIKETGNQNRLTEEVKQKGDLAHQQLVNEGNAAVADTKTYGAAPKLTVAEQQSRDAANSVMNLGPQILSKLEAAHPGIGANPEKFGTPLDALSSFFGKKWYQAGMSSSENVNQDIGYVEQALARAMASGRVSNEQINMIKMHLPQVGFSDGENYKRLHHLMTNILPAIFQGVEETHVPGGQQSMPAPGAVQGRTPGAGGTGGGYLDDQGNPIPRRQ